MLNLMLLHTPQFEEERREETERGQSSFFQWRIDHLSLRSKHTYTHARTHAYACTYVSWLSPAMLGWTASSVDAALLIDGI